MGLKLVWGVGLVGKWSAVYNDFGVYVMQELKLFPVQSTCLNKLAVVLVQLTR